MITESLSNAASYVTPDVETIGKLRDQLIGFTESIAARSRGSLTVVYIVTATNVFALVVFLTYFVVFRGYSWLWTPLPLTLMAIPTAVIWVYQRILTEVASLPNQIADTADEAIAAVADYGGEIPEISEGGLSLFKRWKSYVFLGKVLWKIKDVTGDTRGVIGAFGLVSLMINPIFWLILLISLIVSVVFSAILMGSCALYAFLF